MMIGGMEINFNTLFWVVLWGSIFAFIWVLVAYGVRKYLDTLSHYRAKKYFLTQNEKYFFYELKKHLSILHYISCQVRLADILEVKPSRKGSEFYRHFYKISSKSIDFVVCDERMNIIACIELDDPTHKRRDRIARDKFVNSIFEDAEVELIRVPFQKNVREIDVKKIADIVTSIKSKRQ